MPGLVNVHTHLEIPPLLERLKSRTYSSWVLDLIKEKRELTREDYGAAVKRNVNALVSTGTTTIGEICTHGISPAHLPGSGVRAYVFQEIISMDPSKPFIYTSGLIKKDNSLIRFGLSPHSPHTVSEQAFRVIHDVSERKRLRLSIHAAESREEGRLLRRSHSGLVALYRAARWDRKWLAQAPSSIALLDRYSMLGPNTLIVHAVDVTDSDIRLIKRRGAAVAHCPRSNRTLRVGVMPLNKMLDAGIPVGLGTDSLASVANLNLWDEMRFACKLHRKSGVSPKDMLVMATTGGARALGMDKDIGSLEPGKRADVIAVPLPRNHTGDFYSGLLRETESSIMTMVNGKIIYRG
ncbi:MAG: amidohydrolase family protein [Nitrospirota bacterium]|nr:amidohydrolase family protein [Nitrospirota bacterium]